MPDEATPPSPDIRPIQALVEDLPVPTALLEGPAHRIAYLNPAFARVVGRGADDLLGLPAAEAFPRWLLLLRRRRAQAGAPSSSTRTRTFSQRSARRSKAVK